ncbi:23S rRNA (adenine(1618)-N(6))-methyltransferase RlmF [Seonamhaeicola sp. ML3]|uniref:23S rRNA (adenine(1618)-N(6))-methyltransferase RlmF n=1 Tax=Seonamhaeicola sp. ML3 TaxID=2937786 RepID=UPI002010928A|nr:23S rRNA (adenine(1618)-N(6))-methyltransferase RlmF [Seonamhaeicola sp. ML3]
MKESNLHPNNKHSSGYDLDALGLVYPQLTSFVFTNEYQTKTIDFADPKAVKALNTALLFKYYGIKFWDFPDENLCPPIPGRVDYIHHLAELLEFSGVSKDVNVLDIGTGANCIYPILGNAEYNWDFVGTDIDTTALEFAQNIVDKNDLNHAISLRFQKDSRFILKGVLSDEDQFTVAMCNPPFYKSEKEAIAATTKKLRGLGKTEESLTRNFSGKHNELWCKGGEKAFLHNYIYESSLFKNQCVWFSALVSKKELIRGLKVALKKLNVNSIKVLKSGPGNKQSRFIAWSYSN